MEIYKASELYNTHQQTLFESPLYDAYPYVWNVYYHDGLDSNDDYMVLRLARPLQPDSEPVYITLQRGGQRRFKSMRAVREALTQIGQHECKVYL